MTAPRRGRTAALTAGLALFAAACAEDAPQDFLNHPVGRNAESADRLWDLTFLVAAVIFFLVEAALVYALVRFRHRPGREAADFHGNTRLEVVLTLIPALILVGIAIPTVSTIFRLAGKPANPLEVKVIGHQFWWEYQYDTNADGRADLVTANEMHIPTDRAVFLIIEGATDDVIHSFWVPRLSGKQDVVPGRPASMTLRTDEPGVYLGQCTEFCGLSHANMRLRVVAQTPDEFDAWVAEQQAPAELPASGPAAAGAQEFLTGACVECHTVAGTEAQGRVGPNLTHFASRSTFAGATFRVSDEEQLRAWLRDPPGEKPGVRMPNLGLSEQQINDLVAFLYTLE
ncbi:MAG: cytochrome c oxidase subunit II [Actinomycetota bacterium]